MVVKNVVEEKSLRELIPYTEEQNMIDDKATAYICENFACLAPITDINQFIKVIN